ncbi:MAG: polysaccharide deacetylase, partial [Tumebacillaceae bacterium]
MRRKRSLLFSLVLALVGACLFATVATAATMDTPYHFGFKKSKEGKLASIDQEGFKPMIVKSEAIFLGDTTQKSLYVTFDNGYENGYTEKV